MAEEIRILKDFIEKEVPKAPPLYVSVFLMTKAAEEVMRADVVLALGTNLKTTLCEQLLGYYGGNKLILITLKEHFSDKYADGVIHDRVDQTLLKILCQSENLHKLY